MSNPLFPLIFSAINVMTGDTPGLSRALLGKKERIFA
jgi:hypothetical protein